MAADSLILFAKPPLAGRVKTRLAQSLGREGAARLYACFLQDAAETARALSIAMPGVSLVCEWALERGSRSMNFRSPTGCPAHISIVRKRARTWGRAWRRLWADASWPGGARCSSARIFPICRMRFSTKRFGIWIAGMTPRSRSALRRTGAITSSG